MDALRHVRDLGASRTDIEVRCFPSDDGAFGAYVDSLLADRDGSGEVSLGGLEARLRARYPQATVSVQSPLGSLLPETVVWYVFRDGDA